MNGKSRRADEGEETYGAIETASHTVIYDRTDGHAWIRPSDTVETEA